MRDPEIRGPIKTVPQALRLIRRWEKWAKEGDEGGTPYDWLRALGDFIEKGRFKGIKRKEAGSR